MLPRTWLTYTALGFMVMLLTGCPGTETPEPEPTRDASRLVGTVVTSTGAAYNGPAEIIFIIYENLKSAVQVGRITSTGEVSVTLPEIMPDDLLFPAAVIFLPEEGEEVCAPGATITISDPDTQVKDVGTAFAGLTTESGTLIYEFDSETPPFPEVIDDIPLFAPKLTSIVKFYVDRDVDIRGTCTLEEREDGITFRLTGTYDLELTRGWNDATLVLEGRELEGGRVLETINTITTGVTPDDTTLFIFSDQ